MPFYILFAWPGMEAHFQTPLKHCIPWFLSHCEVSCTSLDSDSIHVQMPLYSFIYWIFIMYQVLLNLGCRVVNKIDKSPALKFYKMNVGLSFSSLACEILERRDCIFNLFVRSAWTIVDRSMEMFFFFFFIDFLFCSFTLFSLWSFSFMSPF